MQLKVEFWNLRSFNLLFALKSDSTHHFFRNACTKSGSLRFSQCSGCWLILSVYIIMSFDFPFVRLFGFRFFCYYSYLTKRYIIVKQYALLMSFPFQKYILIFLVMARPFQQVSRVLCFCNTFMILNCIKEMNFI